MKGEWHSVTRTTNRFPSFFIRIELFFALFLTLFHTFGSAILFAMTLCPMCISTKRAFLLIFDSFVFHLHFIRISNESNVTCHRKLCKPRRKNPLFLVLLHFPTLFSYLRKHTHRKKAIFPLVLCCMLFVLLLLQLLPQSDAAI